MKLLARGKINLILNVLYKRVDGYHELDSIMHSIAFGDEITLTKRADRKIHLTASHKDVPGGKDNLAYRSALVMMEAYPHIGGVNIHIDKKLPMAAGLAGGTTDGAAVFHGLNLLYDLQLSIEDLKAMAAPIGADFSFCIDGGVRRAQGIGEKLTPISSKLIGHVLIVTPPILVSTPKTYQGYDPLMISHRPRVEDMVKAMEENNLKEVVKHLSCDLASVTEKDHPIITEIRHKLIEEGATGALMSGSGPSVFGLFEEEEAAKMAGEALRSYGNIIVTTLQNDGGIIVLQTP